MLSLASEGFGQDEICPMPSAVRPWPFARWIQREALPGNNIPRASLMVSCQRDRGKRHNDTNTQSLAVSMLSGSWSTYCRKHDSETVESEWGEEPIVQVIDGKGILHTMDDCEYIHGKLGTDD